MIEKADRSSVESGVKKGADVDDIKWGMEILVVIVIWLVNGERIQIGGCPF
jgi:hypothetical protein